MNDDKEERGKLTLIFEELKAIRGEITKLDARVNSLEGRPAPEIKREELRPEPSPPPPPGGPEMKMPPPEIKTPKRKGAEKIEKGSLEAKIGGKWLNRIGVVAVVIGMAFFVKYAFDNDWIGETGRVILGIIVGLALIGWGEFLKKKYKYYSQGVVGGGVAILYVSIFAAAGYYSIISQTGASFLIVLITIFSIMLSVRYDASAIAALGFIGGFLNPLILHHGDLEQLPTLAYLVLLDLGILVLAYFKNWKYLNFFAFVATVIIFGIWAGQSYNPKTDVESTQLFLTIFFLIFASLAFFYNIVHRTKTTLFDLGLVLATAFTFFGTSYFNLKEHYKEFMGLFAGFMGAVYFGMGLLTHWRNYGDRRLILTFLSAALTFLVLMIPIQLDKNWVTIGWAVEAAALTWIGIRLNSTGMRIAGVGLLTFTIGRLFIFDFPGIDIGDPSFYPFLNDRFFTALFVSIILFFVALLYYSKGRSYSSVIDPKERKTMSTILFIAANVLLIVTLSVESYDLFESKIVAMGPWPAEHNPAYADRLSALQYAQMLSLSGIWAVYSIILVILGFIRKHTPSRIFAIALFGITIFKVFIIDLSGLEQVYRIVSFIGLGVILLSVSFLYTRYKDKIIEAVVGDGTEDEE
ncbi:MAG: DUF2339 domain-containing protein [Deltaproteobacteria bacterium]|uniref:DUF2339 domain-containing protein n=1 Tax=Candidatus Zymogenus saltonus TaxID=2844893 RepID=A0A9D8KAU5_9DELT|nr:DUF2339 domain-containing protein [Candidatus Zymogenus saltonus]